MKILKITYNVFKIGCFLCFSFILTLVLVVKTKRDIKFNDSCYQFVISEYEYKKDHMLMIELPPNGVNERKIWNGILNVGDVFIVNYNNQEISAWISNINDINNEYIIRLISHDINKKIVLNVSNELSVNKIEGKVVYVNDFLGFIVLNLFKTRYLIIYIIFPLLGFVGVELLFYKKAKKGKRK